MNSRRISVVIFYDNKKRILLQGRTGISKSGNEWGFFGGGIEENETPEQAIIREAKEELDFDLKQFKYIGKYDEKFNENFSVIVHVFVSPLNDNLPKFKQKEGKGMKMFSLTEAEKLKIPEHAKRVINDLKNLI